MAALHVLLDWDLEQRDDEPPDAPQPCFILSAAGMDSLCLLRDMLDVQNPNIQDATFGDLQRILDWFACITAASGSPAEFPDTDELPKMRCTAARGKGGKGNKGSKGEGGDES